MKLLKVKFERPSYSDTEKNPDIAWKFVADTDEKFPNGSNGFGGVVRKAGPNNNDWQAQSWSMRSGEMGWGPVAPDRETAIAAIFEETSDGIKKWELKKFEDRRKELLLAEIRETGKASVGFAWQMFAALKSARAALEESREFQGEILEVCAEVREVLEAIEKAEADIGTRYARLWELEGLGPKQGVESLEDDDMLKAAKDYAGRRGKLNQTEAAFLSGFEMGRPLYELESLFQRAQAGK